MSACFGAEHSTIFARSCVGLVNRPSPTVECCLDWPKPKPPLKQSCKLTYPLVLCTSRCLNLLGSPLQTIIDVRACDTHATRMTGWVPFTASIFPASFPSFLLLPLISLLSLSLTFIFRPPQVVHFILLLSTQQQ